MCPLCGGIGRRWGQRPWEPCHSHHGPASFRILFVCSAVVSIISMGFFCLLAVAVVIPESRQSGIPSTRPMDDGPPNGAIWPCSPRRVSVV